MDQREDSLSKKTILVVEDDSILRTTLVNQLKPKFFVIEAGSGEKALQEISDNKPDLVVLDLLLPNVNGFEVLDRIRRHPDPVIAKTKVIILSNFTQSEDILKAKNLSVSDYLIKSETGLNELEAKIKDALNGLI